MLYSTNKVIHYYLFIYVIKQFFKENGVNINEDLYATSELIQWLWRSRIRKYESINVYIPSKRMRSLLIDWLDN